MAKFPTPSQLATQYLQILQSIKPSININDASSDFVIRGNVWAAFVSGVYGDQARVDDNTYISSASPESLTLHGQDLGIIQNGATKANSTDILITGTAGTVVNTGDLTFIFDSTGVTYTNTVGGTLQTSGNLHLSAVALSPGIIGNVGAGQSIGLLGPPAGINTVGTVIVAFASGTDRESTDSYRARLLNRLQQPPSGGNLNDLRNFAFAGDSSVRTVIVVPFALGLGTAAVYITGGSTTQDIDTAITNGEPIIRVPSQTVINNVQSYYYANAPITTCVSVYGPNEITFNGTVYVDLAPNLTLSSVPSDPVNNPLGITIEGLIRREYGRALYNCPVGGFQVEGHGYLLASDIEKSMLTHLSSEANPSTGAAYGLLPVLSDIRIPQLSPPNTNLLLNGNWLVAPGIITVVLGT